MEYGIGFILPLFYVYYIITMLGNVYEELEHKGYPQPRSLPAPLLCIGARLL